jgi:hypothetical protein
LGFVRRESVTQDPPASPTTIEAGLKVIRTRWPELRSPAASEPILTAG